MSQFAKKRILALGLVLLGGCVVQSFYPFYTDEAKVSLPSIAGSWQPIDKDSPANTAERPWVFTTRADGQYEFLTYDKDKPGKLKATFFKVGTNLFCDFSPADVLPEDAKINGYWAFHVRPVHSVARVETNSDRLTFVPLSFDWVRAAVQSNQVTLAHLQGKEKDDLLFTARPQEWSKFLADHAANTNAFKPDSAYAFRRSKTQ